MNIQNPNIFHPLSITPQTLQNPPLQPGKLSRIPKPPQLIPPLQHQPMLLDAAISRQQHPGFSVHHSNNVLCKQYKDCICFSLPAYVRLQYQGMTSIQIPQKTASMDSVLVISIYFGDLPFELVDAICQKLQVRVNTHVNFTLSSDDFQKNQYLALKKIRNDESKVLTFVLRAEFPLEMQCTILLTPFEKLMMNLAVKLSTVSTVFLGKKTDIDFNLMYAYKELSEEELDLEDPSQNCSIVDYDRMIYLKQHQDFAEYGLAETLTTFKITASLQSEQSNQDRLARQQREQLHIENYELPREMQEIQDRENQENFKKRQELQRKIRQKVQRIQQECKIDYEECLYRISLFEKRPQRVLHWDTANFSVSLYRKPFTSILMVFLPTILLALFNLSIFFQQSRLGGRISALASLLVGFTAFLPTVRNRIPPTPKVTIFEICLYAVISTTLLCLARSFIMNFDSNKKKFNWREDPFFLISLFIVFIVCNLMIIGIIAYRCVLEPSYNAEREQRYFLADLKDPYKWYNPVADRYWRNTPCTSQYLKYNSFFFSQQWIFYRLWLERLKKHQQETQKHMHPSLSEGTSLNTPSKYFSMDSYDRQIYRAAKKFRQARQKYIYSTTIILNQFQMSLVAQIQYLDEVQKRFYEERKKIYEEIVQVYPQITKEYQEAMQTFLKQYQWVNIYQTEPAEFKIITKKKRDYLNFKQSLKKPQKPF